MPAPRTGRLLLVGAGVTVLVGAAVLARPGTAADEEQVDAARSALAPPSVAAVPSPSAPPPTGAFVVRADGVDGLRLGMGADEVTAAGFVVEPDARGGCRRVLPGLADTGPGPGVAGWLVEDRVQSVTVDSRAGEASSFLGPGPGGRLDDLAGGAGLLRASLRQAVPWREAPVLVEVAWVRPDPDVRVAFADLTEDGTIDHVEVRADAAEGCADAAAAAEAELEDTLPVLGRDGWGELRIGMPLEEATSLVDTRTVAASDAPPRCRLLLADEEPGLVYLVVGLDETGRDVVRAVSVDAGRTDAGLAVGDTAEQVSRAYPGITQAYLDERWRQGLIADWQLDGTVLRLAPTREQVRVTAVDAVLTGPRNVVGLVQLGPGC